jgi:hypothetical protein
MTIDRDDLEAKLRQIEDVVEETKQQAQYTGVVVAVLVVATVALAYYYGRRKGAKAGGARVEVYKLR